MRKFVLGDIHGAHKALIECLKGVSFDYEADMLIFLGDVCDGWSETIECIEELMKIKHLVYIRGNHDDWTLNYLRGQLSFKMSSTGTSWLHHGGQITKDRLDAATSSERAMVKSFLRSGVKYHIDTHNNVYTHAGFNLNESIELQSWNTFMWDRNMVLDAINKLDKKEKVSDEDSYFGMRESFYNSKNIYNKIYIGHTPTTYLIEDSDMPMNLGTNIVLLDTGAAFSGKLTIMNVDDGGIFQSTPPYLLYLNEKGRN